MSTLKVLSIQKVRINHASPLLAEDGFYCLGFDMDHKTRSSSVIKKDYQTGKPTTIKIEEMVSLEDHKLLLSVKDSGGLTNHISMHNDLLFIWFDHFKKCIVMNVYKKIGGKYIRLKQTVNQKEQTLVQYLKENY